MTFYEERTIYTDMAERILFGRVKNAVELNKFIDLKLEYRKNKVFGDVNKAIAKGKKQSKKTPKIEFEISWVALYLKDVFKKVRVKNNVLSSL
jgi:hypothetical protein